MGRIRFWYTAWMVVGYAHYCHHTKVYQANLSSTVATESERQQQQSPALNEQQWDRLLSQNNFSGAELVFHGHKLKRMRWASMIVATAVEGSGNQKSHSLQH